MYPAADRTLTLINADIGGGAVATLRVQHGRLAAVGGAPERSDTVFDLRGDRVLPGLINAHDHLQLNGYPRLRYRDHYLNVREWIGDVRARVATDRELVRCGSLPREHRLLAGGLKNLLSGVTTVAHHDPLYESLLDPGYPIRVVVDYGWSHSLGVDGAESVRQSHRRTAAASPWIIHAAEGVDDEASTEFERLEAMGCVGPNTLLVHGVALHEAQRARLAASGTGLIWCPASNLHLFGRTADVGALIREGRVALGSDSRMTGANDLLAELSIARTAGKLDDAALEALVTRQSARLLRLTDRGALDDGALADLLILPAGLPLCAASRADVRLVMIGGVPLYGDRDCARGIAPTHSFVDILVDARPKVLDSRLASRLIQARVVEDGVEIPSAGWRAA